MARPQSQWRHFVVSADETLEVPEATGHETHQSSR